MSSQDQWPQQPQQYPPGQQPGQYPPPGQYPTQQQYPTAQYPTQQWAAAGTPGAPAAVVKQVKRWPAATGAGVLGLLLGAGIGASGSGSDTTASTAVASKPAVTVTVTAAAQAAAPATSAAKPAIAPKPPGGVTVSGEKAKALTIVSFKGRKDALGQFAPVLRIKNVSGDDLSFVSVKVTALKGEDVVATADGIIESISAGQTVTYEPISGDDFGSGKGIRYDIEIGG